MSVRVGSKEEIDALRKMNEPKKGRITLRTRARWAFCALTGHEPIMATELIDGVAITIIDCADCGKVIRTTSRRITRAMSLENEYQALPVSDEDLDRIREYARKIDAQTPA